MMLPRPPSVLTPNNADARVSPASPLCIEPYWTFKSTPSKSLRVMKLTTPATASAPYTDERLP